MSESHIGTLDIEIYSGADDGWAQGKYLVHGFKDILWTDNLNEAIEFFKQSIEEMEGGK